MKGVNSRPCSAATQSTGGLVTQAAPSQESPVAPLAGWPPVGTHARLTTAVVMVTIGRTRAVRRREALVCEWGVVITDSFGICGVPCPARTDSLKGRKK